MDPARTPSPIAEEPDDDASSVRYVRNIKRIMEKTQPHNFEPKMTQPVSASLIRQQQLRATLTSPSDHTIGLHSLDGPNRQHYYLNPENRSLYSLNEYASSSFYHMQQLDRPSSGQFETSFATYDIDHSDTDNQAFEFVLPSNEEQNNRAPLYAGRYFSNNTAESLRDHDHHSNDLSESSEPDLNSNWSWKNLKREFRLSHSESLFHLYQAKLQHSFFVALLILNIIFNLGAILPYAISKYNQLNVCKWQTSWILITNHHYSANQC